MGFNLEHELNLAWTTVLKMTDDTVAYVPNLFLGVIVYLLFAKLSKSVRGLIMHVCVKGKLDTTLCHALATLASTFFLILGILATATIVVPGFKPAHVVAGLGITSVVVGFAFKDILQNFLAGLLLLWQKPFRIGDLIKTSDFEGVVEEVNIRSTHLRAMSGDLIVVPNGNIFTNPIIVRASSKSNL